MDFSKVAEAAGCYVPAAIARCLAKVRAGRSALLDACMTKL